MDENLSHKEKYLAELYRSLLIEEQVFKISLRSFHKIMIYVQLFHEVRFEIKKRHYSHKG